jgi:hypothetical protein
VSYRTAYRRALDKKLPLHRRIYAFQVCLEMYCWLTTEQYGETYDRLAAEVGFESVPLDADHLVQAITILDAERHRFLERLAAFQANRKRQKAQGRRQSTRAEVAALYVQDWYLTRDTRPRPRYRGAGAVAPNAYRTGAIWPATDPGSLGVERGD